MPNNEICAHPDLEAVVELLKTVPTRNGYVDIPEIANHLISNGVTVQKWIPVSEEPEEDGKYLVLNESGQIFDAEYSVINGFGYWDNYYDSETLAVVDSWWDGFDGITHWMPLPEPPKGE